MMPGSGFDVAEVQDGRYFTARAPDQTVSWCLAVEPAGPRSCRVISRWRARWRVTPASAAWIALAEPGAFIMERRMLLGIRARAEQAAGDGHLRYAAPGMGSLAAPALRAVRPRRPPPHRRLLQPAPDDLTARSLGAVWPGRW